MGRRRRSGRRSKSSFSAAEVVFLVVVLPLVFILGVRGTLAYVMPIAPVRGNSMNPTLENGDICLVVPKLFLKPTDIGVGDIVAFTHENDPYMHRIVGVVNQGGLVTYQTKGDNSAGPDPFLITYDDIVAKLVANLRVKLPF